MRTLRNILWIVAAMAVMAACIKQSAPTHRGEGGSEGSEEEPYSPDTDYLPYSQDSTAVLLYSAAFNNLSKDIKENIRKIGGGQIPVKNSRKKLLIFAHLARANDDYETPMKSHLVWVYAGEGNMVFKDPLTGVADTLIHNVHCDTLLTFDASVTACDPTTLHQVLEFVQNKFPEHKYGLVLSSHGTGWLPAGVYNSTNYYPPVMLGKKRPASEGLPLYLYNQNPSEPAVRTFGAEAVKEGKVIYSKEMGITSLASAIPGKLEFIIFDACLMGCVEVAYELRNVTESICFSPTEILSAGMYYETFIDRLLARDRIDKYAEDYFRYYNSRVGTSRSAAVAVVRTEGLETLAQICKELTLTYREHVDTVGTDVQKYFRGNNSWFYDLKDIYVQSHISLEDQKRLQLALDACVVYKAFTPEFLGLQLLRCCGLAMYLPNRTVKSSKETVNAYYRTLAWNNAVNLVE